MRKRKNDKWKENGHALTCPHCAAGGDGITLGLFWDCYDQCWRCLMCGYRKYKHPERPKTKAEIVAERIWDQVLDALDQEDIPQSFNILVRED
jgi:rubredoxin